MLPLRGFLICPKCGRMLTGSGSKGCKQKYYHYYHCSSSCGIRYNASKVNNDIVEEIKKYVRPLPKLQLYKEVISSTFKSKTRLQRNEVTQLSAQLDEANKRLSKARDLLLAGDIEANDYRTINSETEEKIHRLEAKLTASVTETTDIEPLLNKVISNISQLNVLYSNGSIIQKRKIISSMFPEKLTFDGFQYRTTRVNEAIRLMCLIDSKVGDKKNGTSLTFSDLSQEVIPLVQNSNYLLEDLRLLCDLLAA
ncbi:MAG TPA: recombinase zinc beta ribbon domain-containing protein [Chitinophagaceae bacterium]|nr:recombinase zinc beta ribbon domain-containing protein [Chitinophagaceae bacterium]